MLAGKSYSFLELPIPVRRFQTTKPKTVFKVRLLGFETDTNVSLAQGDACYGLMAMRYIVKNYNG